MEDYSIHASVSTHIPLPASGPEAPVGGTGLRAGAGPEPAVVSAGAGTPEGAEGLYPICTGLSRTQTVWKQQYTDIATFVRRCRRTRRTSETMAEYRAMSRDEQGRIKDVGGFVLGRLQDGIRRKDTVLGRCAVTLDLDHGTPGIVEDLTHSHRWHTVLYSTHKHTPEQPRLRYRQRRTGQRGCGVQIVAASPTM